MKAFVIALAIGTFLCVSAQAHPRHHRHVRHHYVHVASGTEELLPHPEGCPRTQYCGCGVADRIFGAPIRFFWLAANWLVFPRTEPAPGMVAVFGHHHVAVIERVVGDGIAEVFDPNSGGHLTRRHLRSIRGAVIVDPHGARVARSEERHIRHRRTRYATSRPLPLHSGHDPDPRQRWQGGAPIFPSSREVPSQAGHSPFPPHRLQVSPS